MIKANLKKKQTLNQTQKKKNKLNKLKYRDKEKKNSSKNKELQVNPMWMRIILVVMTNN